MSLPNVYSLGDQAEHAIGLVVEGACSVCKVELRVHDSRGCYPCCGDGYRVALIAANDFEGRS